MFILFTGSSLGPCDRTEPPNFKGLQIMLYTVGITIYMWDIFVVVLKLKMHYGWSNFLPDDQSLVFVS
jgi:hypothetical protein